MFKNLTVSLIALSQCRLAYTKQSLDGKNQEGNDVDSERSNDYGEEGEDELDEDQIAALKTSGYEIGEDDDEEGEFDLDDDEEAEYDDEDVEDEDDEDYDDEDDEPAAKRPKK